MFLVLNLSMSSSTQDHPICSSWTPPASDAPTRLCSMVRNRQHSSQQVAGQLLSHMALAASRDSRELTPSVWGPFLSLLRHSVRIPMDPFHVKTHTYAPVAAEEIDQNLIEGSVSGLMGLAFQALAETEAPPFWQALITNNQLDAPEMAFQLTRSTSLQDQPGGTFTLGGTNSSLFTGDIEFHDLVSTPSFWLLSLSGIYSYIASLSPIDPRAGVTMQGKSVSISTGNSAISAIDTGTTAIGGPTADVNAIWAAVPGASAVEERGGEGFFQFRL